MSTISRYRLISVLNTLWHKKKKSFWEAWTTVFKYTCVLYYVSYVFLMEVLMQDQIGD